MDTSGKSKNNIEAAPKIKEGGNCVSQYSRLVHSCHVLSWFTSISIRITELVSSYSRTSAFATILGSGKFAQSPHDGAYEHFSK